MSSAATSIQIPGGAAFYEQITTLKIPEDLTKAREIICDFVYHLRIETPSSSLTEETVQKDTQLLSAEIQKICKVAKELLHVEYDYDRICLANAELELLAKYYSQKYTTPCKSAGTPIEGDFWWQSHTASDFIHRGMINVLINMHSSYNQSGDMAANLSWIHQAAQSLLNAEATGKVYDKDKNLLDAKTVAEEFVLLSEDLEKICELSELESKKPDRENWRKNEQLQKMIQELRIKSVEFRSRS